MTSRQLRLVRAAAVSSVATLIAAVSHTLGGGAAPHPLLIVAVIALLTPLSAVLIGVRQSPARVAATVLFSQAAFHLLFQALGSPTGTGLASSSGHAHHVDLQVLGPLVPTAGVDVSMLLAHVVAAALTTLLVWRGESVVRTIAGWVRALLRRGAPTAPADHRRPATLRSFVLPPFDAAVSPAVSRRGPPALLRG